MSNSSGFHDPPSDQVVHLFVFATSVVGILFALFQFSLVQRIKLKTTTSSYGLIQGEGSESSLLAEQEDELLHIYETIRSGAKAFLWAEYKICFIFIFVFGAIVLILGSHFWEDPDWQSGWLTAISFAVGGLTSILSGYIGMMVAVYSNARTAIAAKARDTATGDDSIGWTNSFNAAFRAGSVMGFSLCGLSMGILYILCLIYQSIYPYAEKPGNVTKLFECIAGYGLGGSSIAMFGRVGGGIFTKAADVGADLAGKVIGVGEGKKLDEDSPYNPACIADNVGDNVGDVAGMGSDLFGSFGEASCAALLVGASVSAISQQWCYLMYPLLISATGIVVCMLVSFVATNIGTVKKEADIETVLKWQLLLTSVLMTVVLYPVTLTFLPQEMNFNPYDAPEPKRLAKVHPIVCWVCVISGLWGGCFIGFITEYFTSHSYQPVRDVARSTETGAATNIIYGLALGYKSAIAPVTIISVIIYVTFKYAGMYGVALGALGMLSTLATCLTIDVYGPVCDNAGGVAEMCEMPSYVRDKTDALDAAGNTTAAIGKGFAIGSAALVSLALFGAFITRSELTIAHKAMKHGHSFTSIDVNLLKPTIFAFLVYGAMIPYWFSAMTMRSVGEAANAMVKEVARQWVDVKYLKEVAGLEFEDRLRWFKQHNNIQVKPEYEKCIAIATNASLREMVPPGLLVIATPILVGCLFGVEAVAGLLSGALASSVQMAISMSNTGGAWDNAKKYTEKGELNGWFAHRGGDDAFSEVAFDAAARRWHGNDAFTNENRDSNGNPCTLSEFLKDCEKNNPELYQDIITGKKPIISNDKRRCIYAGKKSEAHAAAVVGDTVGDPLKDTSGPALNIVMKLMAILSVVFAETFVSIYGGNGLLKTGDLKVW